MSSFYASDTPQVAFASDEEFAKLSPAQSKLFALRMATDPPRPMREVAAIIGVSTKTADKRWKAIKVKLGRDPLIEWKQKGLMNTGALEQFERLRMVPSDTLIKLAEMRAEAMLRAITPEKLAEASVRDLTSGYRELINSRQLLKGEPTQILQVNQRENLKRLFPVVLRQLQRRGISLDDEMAAAAARFKGKGPGSPELIDVDLGSVSAGAAPEAEPEA